MGYSSSVGGGGGGGGGGGVALPSNDGVIQKRAGVVVSAELTQDQIGAAFGVGLGGGGNVDIGAVITAPNLTKSFSGATPSSVTLNPASVNGGASSNATGLASRDVTAQPSTFADTGAVYTMGGRGSVVGKTITAVANGVTKSGGTSWTAYSRNRRGVAAPGMGSVTTGGAATGRSNATIAAFILALGSTTFAGSRNDSFTLDAGTSAGNKIYYATVTANGNATFAVGGFAGGYTKVASAVPCVVNGITENYDLYETNNPNLGSVSTVVT